MTLNDRLQTQRTLPGGCLHRPKPSIVSNEPFSAQSDQFTYESMIEARQGSQDDLQEKITKNHDKGQQRTSPESSRVKQQGQDIAIHSKRSTEPFSIPKGLILPNTKSERKFAVKKGNSSPNIAGKANMETGTINPLGEPAVILEIPSGLIQKFYDIMESRPENEIEMKIQVLGTIKVSEPDPNMQDKASQAFRTKIYSKQEISLDQKSEEELKEYDLEKEFYPISMEEIAIEITSMAEREADMMREEALNEDKMDLKGIPTSDKRFHEYWAKELLGINIKPTRGSPYHTITNYIGFVDKDHDRVLRQVYQLIEKTKSQINGEGLLEFMQFHYKKVEQITKKWLKAHSSFEMEKGGTKLTISLTDTTAEFQNLTALNKEDIMNSNYNRTSTHLIMTQVDYNTNRFKFAYRVIHYLEEINGWRAIEVVSSKTKVPANRVKTFHAIFISKAGKNPQRPLDLGDNITFGVQILDTGYQRCSICDEVGHQRQSCRIPCSRCGYRGHRADECKTKLSNVKWNRSLNSQGQRARRGHIRV